MLNQETLDKEKEIVDLPYNVKNRILNKEDIIEIFKSCSLDFHPVNIHIYQTAMVHKSYCTRKNENFTNGNVNCPDDCLPLQEESFERLEFLGDTVIATVIGNYLFDRFPERENEGFLTEIRTKLVNGTMLALLCSLTKLPQYVIISKQIEINEGRTNKKILEDVFEAFVGAMFKDFHLQMTSDFDADEQQKSHINPLRLCETWLINLIEDNVDFTKLILSHTNYKYQFIKTFTTLYGYTPQFYEINHETTPQGKRYDVCIKDNMQAIIATGTGTSKKLAENDAAFKCLQTMEKL